MQRYGYLPSSFDNVHSLVDKQNSLTVLCPVNNMFCIN